MKNIRTTLAIVFLMGCIVYLGYEFIVDKDYTINYIIYDWRWKLGFIIAYIIHTKKRNKTKAT